MATQKTARRSRTAWALTLALLSAGVSVGVVSKVVARAARAGLDWPAIEALDEDSLDVRLFGPRLSATASRSMPDPVCIHVERKKPGVTLELLHVE
jgi:hypothetical protein